MLPPVEEATLVSDPVWSEQWLAAFPEAHPFVRRTDRHATDFGDWDVIVGHAWRGPRCGRRALDLLDTLHVSARIGKAMAAERGLSYAPSQSGEYVAGRLAGVATLASGHFAMIEDGMGFQLVPWQPVLEKQIGKHISGVAR